MNRHTNPTLWEEVTVIFTEVSCHDSSCVYRYTACIHSPMSTPGRYLCSIRHPGCWNLSCSRVEAIVFVRVAMVTASPSFIV